MTNQCHNENVLGTLSPLTERGARPTLTQALAHALYDVVQCKWYIMVLYHRQTKAALCVRETGRTARLGLSSMHCCFPHTEELLPKRTLVRLTQVFCMTC